MITVIGGCYREVCLRPAWNQMFGSGVRAAAAISELTPTPPHLVTRAAGCDRRTLGLRATPYGFDLDVHPRPVPVEFQYDHPLKRWPGHRRDRDAERWGPAVRREAI